MHLHRIPFFLFALFSLAYAKKGKDKSPEAEHVGTNSEKYTVYPFPNPVTLDISNVSNDFVHTEAQYHDWTTYVSSPVTEKNMVEVRDGNSSIWKGDGKTEKCFSVTRHIKGDLELLDLNLFTRAGKCSRKYFEKSGGSWKEMSLEEYEKNKPKSDTYTLLDGREFNVKVEYIPVENPKEPEFTPTEDEGKKNSKTPQKQPQANAQPAAKSPEAQTVADPPPEPVQPTPQGGAQTKSADKPVESPSEGSPEQTESKEASTETSDDNTSKTILDKDVKVVKPTVETYKSDQGDLTTLDIKKPNLHVINLRETLDKNEVRNRIYGRTGMSPITSVVDGGFEFYKGSTEVQTVLSFSKGSSTLLFVQYKQRLDGKWVDYFENSGGSWKSITQEEYHTKYKAMKSVEILKQLAKPHQFKTKPLPKRDTSARNAGSNTPETGKVKLQIDGIDSETYAIERSIEDNVVFVKCSSKIGKTPSEFLYGPDKIWSGKKDYHLVSSTSYLEDNLPKMALLKIIKDKSYEFVYAYKNGDAWEEENEQNHQARLEEMKKRGAKNPPKLPDDIIPPKAPEPEDKQEEKPAPTTLQESKEETSASPLPAASETSQPTSQVQQIPQEKQTVPDTKVGAPKPVPRHHFTKELVVPITLDLAKVDTNSVDVPDTTTKDGINTTYYYPKGKFYFNKIVDGTRTVWESTEEKCSPAYTISKGNVTFLALLLKKSDDETDLIYYEKKNLGWELIEKTKCEKIIEELKRPSVAPMIKEVELDLTDVDREIFVARASQKNGLTEKTFTVKEGYRLTELYELNVPIWRGENGSSCSQVTVHYDGNELELTSLSLGIESLYLHVKDGKWVGVSKDDYDVALTEMKRLASLPKARTVELDVADVDGNVFVVKEETVEGLPLKTVAPKEGYKLTEIYDINVPIWRGADKEHALSVLVCYDGEAPVSVVVNFVKADGKNVWRYHNMQGNKWSVVKKKDYENLLKKLKVSEENEDKESPNVENQVSRESKDDPNVLENKSKKPVSPNKKKDPERKATRQPRLGKDATKQ
ncbi:hypothetical protein BEWA_020860 [Theileria equi strain WA]|uniref:Signal peptide containing protein n=1 Tax=Theileria equi strain WA TaxID=1537102 RepID=L0AWF3_THEEQ|nr:hypothetical protein BEWA_020860 [Theileria equi strain WA]AFZ79239.1 hypothetical protein BEWA_020860 [Theileria equi strain WA]|eukprot:XP_004828905.1 hypothetical protein BEWA_020860 [Theileria equi strain WA]